MANQINVGVGADIRNLQEGLKVAVSTMEKSGKDMTAVGASVARLTESNFKDLSQAYRVTSKDAVILASQLGTDSEAFKQAAQMAQVYGNELAGVKAKIAGVDLGTQPVQKAAGQFNMLGNSLNQITRELPAFTYSMQTGFMAVSNNIPMFVDQIHSIKRANAELISQGQPVQSVFKQLAGALFSWQTALSLGVTVLTVYGAEIVKFFTGVKQSKEELDKLAASQQALNDKVRDYLMTDQQKSIYEENEAHKKVTEAIKSRIKTTQILEDEYGRVSATIKGLTFEEILVNEKAKKDLEIAETRHQERISAIKNRYKKKEDFTTYDDAFQVQTIEIKTLGFDAAIVGLERMKKAIEGIKPVSTESFVAVQGEVNKVGVFFDELGEKIGGWANMATNAMMGFAVSTGEALASGEFKGGAEAIVRQLGNIAVQIGAAMVAIGLVASTVGVGVAYVTAGLALGILGGAMIATGKAPDSKTNTANNSSGSYRPSEPMFNPTFGGGSQYLMLSSTVRGTDIIISADNQRRQNRRIR